MLSSTKSWYQSKTIWGGLVTLAAVVAGLFGVTLTAADQASLTLILTQAVAVVGAIVALYGRVVARSRIG